jgi:hypothetical protein
VRLYPDGRLVTAAMAQGPNGFGIARFGDEAPVETELPNLLLEPVADAKAPRVLKKTSALAKPPPAKTSANTSASNEKMYYAKQTGRQFGGVMAIGSRFSSLAPTACPVQRWTLSPILSLAP